jgi:GNAT superfamily N-acetyltransferase
MELREPEDADAPRLRELARSAMTAAYALGPRQLDTIVEARFDEEALTDAFASEDRVVLLAENGESEVSDEPTVVGFVTGERREGGGEIGWLFVDPEHRGRGVGTQLFEAGADALRGSDTGDLTATALEANTEGGTFFERLGLERTDERRVEIGEESLVEYVYAEERTAEKGDTETTNGIERDAMDDADVADADLPGAETRGDVTLARTDDGTQVYLDREETESGVEAPFLIAYADEAYTDRYGYYCGNCGSLDTVLDESERIECADCGNVRAERLADAYDDAYL